MTIFEKPHGVQTYWSSFENPAADRGCTGSENQAHKGFATDSLEPVIRNTQ